MKRSLVRGFIFGTMLVGLASIPASAEELARVSVAFPFLVNGRMLPAGQYDVRSDDQDPALLVIEGVDHPKAHAVVATIPDSRPDPFGDEPALTFVRKGGVWQLSEVWETSNDSRQIVLHAR